MVCEGDVGLRKGKGLGSWTFSAEQSDIFMEMGGTNLSLNLEENQMEESGDLDTRVGQWVPGRSNRCLGMGEPMKDSIVLSIEYSL